MSRLQPARRIEHWMPLADDVAPKVRAMPHYAWVRLSWFWTPEGLAAFEPEIVTPGVEPIDWRNVVLAGEWITKFDAYRVEKDEEAEEEKESEEEEEAEEAQEEDDGEPADPDARPHSNIYTEDYR